MDSSGSISVDEASDIEDAYFAFLNGLEGTGSFAGVIDFDTTATVEIDPGPAYLEITSGNIAGDFTTYINTFTPGGFTNWEDAFLDAAGYSNPDLVVLITDGDPTTDNSQGGSLVDEHIALQPAIAAANALKSANPAAHILAVGVGSSPSESNLVAVSGPDVFDTNVAVINSSTVPGLDVILANFAVSTRRLAVGPRRCAPTSASTSLVGSMRAR